jgi:hypothetical protein
MHAASMMRWRCQRIPLHRALCALQLPSPFCPHRSHRQGAIMLFNAALTKRSPYWLSPGSISTSCYHHLLSPPKTPNITPNDTKTARHSTTPISTMSQDKGNRRLIECLALAREQQNAPHQGNETTTSNDCIDPRLLALSHDAVIQEEDVHASSSTGSQTGSAVSQRNYLGSPSDDSALSESG